MPTDRQVVERVRSAYADERFETPFEQVVARAKRARRPWRPALPIGAGVAVAATAAALVLLVSFLSRPDPVRPAAWGATFAGDCARVWATAPLDSDPAVAVARAGRPPSEHVFSFWDGNLGLRIYVQDTIMFACRRDSHGNISGRVSMHFPQRTGNTLDTVAVFAQSGGPDYYVGRLAVPADRVLARRSNGQIFRGDIQGGVFAIWAPRGGLSGAAVEAYQGDARVASGRPNFLGGEYHAEAFGWVCDGAVAEALRSHRDVRDRSREVPPRIRLATAGRGRWARLYASEWYMAACTRNPPDGSISTQLATQKVAWEPLQILGSFGASGWIIGAAPVGAELVKVDLGEGRTINAELAGGFFTASWSYVADSGVTATIVALTPTTVYERVGGGPVSSGPR